MSEDIISINFPTMTLFFDSEPKYIGRATAPVGPGTEAIGGT